ncbi:MAG: Smr/MutS family protein [Spirochaetaceae bacterium]|jgi:DNA mismatch repair protein MutS2|nr:Smr/MutS family protein [Spirochaetaceae bacterium]
MNEKTCRLLEFDRVKERVAAYTRSGEAAALIMMEEPLNSAAALTALHGEVAHIITRINSSDSEPCNRLPEIAPLFARLTPERAALSLEDAFALGAFLAEGVRVQLWAKLEAGASTAEASAETPAQDGSDEAEKCAALIFAVVAPDGSMRDLPELRRIKERIRAIQREVKTIAASFARDTALRPMLQSELPSQRDGRTVLALKANFRGRVRGIVHEVSASGQTLFIEPEALIEKNNELRIEERALDAEIRRILRDLTAHLAPYRTAIEHFHARLIRLDALRARAHFAIAVKGVFGSTPETGNGTADICLLKARHPLLAGEAVPIDIAMKNGVRALIITGPNAGGKTVALKTVGLFVLMNQAGFALPAAAAVLPVFDDVFAGIGDEQSLSGSLSTFSAHTQSLAAICRKASARSLVLLDELGAGTGVEEGGALAMALLDNLIARGTTLFVTTHTSALKNYGWTRSAVENASMEFDTVTGKPTYRVLMGVPGESRAFVIARRSGIPRSIIEQATAYLERGDSDSARIISGLQTKITNLERERRAFEEERRAFEKECHKLEERAVRLREKEAALKAGELGKLRALRDESRKKLENLVRILQEGAGKPVTRDKTSAVKEFLGELEEAVREEEAAFETENAFRGKAAMDGTAPLAPHEITPGLAVLVGERRRPGVVKKKAKRGMWLVEVGSLSFSAAPEELYPALQTAQKPVAVSLDLSPAAPLFAELDLRGLRLADALEALEKQLDAAVRVSLGEFAVIHGTGDGILQRGVHEYLKTQHPVADYYFSRPELGGMGRTEVILRC